MRVKGVALVQVLLITSILSILMLFISKTTQQKIYAATQFNDKTKAYVENYDVEAKVLFALLTENKSPLKHLESQTVQNVFLDNFHGGKFNVGKYHTVKLQDLRGLLNIHFPNTERWMAFLTSQNMDEMEARSVLNRITDWQDLNTVSRYNLPEKNNKNGPIQSFDELVHLDISLELREILPHISTYYKSSAFNPLTAPDLLIESLYNKVIAEQILDHRDRDMLSPSTFTLITGEQQKEGVYYYPSNNFKITLKTKVGNARVQRTLYYKLGPSKAAPVNLLATEG